MSHCQNSLTQFKLGFFLRLYEALAFLARGDVLSSDFPVNPISCASCQDKWMETPPIKGIYGTADKSSVQHANWNVESLLVSCLLWLGQWALTPCWFPFVRLALWADRCRRRLLLGRLVLAVLPPLLQLEVNEFPHHPGLCQADSCQTSHPEGERRRQYNYSMMPLVRTLGERISLVTILYYIYIKHRQDIHSLI